MIRKTKIAAAFLIGMLGLLLFLNNLFNLSPAYDAVSFVVSSAEQPFLGGAFRYGSICAILMFFIASKND